jgi:hypothetical protein
MSDEHAYFAKETGAQHEIVWRSAAGAGADTVTITDLPPPDTERWVASRKAIVVAAVRSGVITLEEAFRRYGLSVEEFDAWRRAVETFGTPGLRATRLQVYRDVPRIRPKVPRKKPKPADGVASPGKVDGVPDAVLVRSRG